MSDNIKKDEAPKGDGDTNLDSAKTAAGNTGQAGTKEQVVGDPTADSSQPAKVN